MSESVSHWFRSHESTMLTNYFPLPLSSPSFGSFVLFSNKEREEMISHEVEMMERMQDRETEMFRREL